MKFSGGINGDYARKYKKSLNILVDEIYKKDPLERDSTPVLYIGCLVPNV